MKYDEVNDILEMKYIPDRIDDETFHQLVFFMVSEIESYLEYREAFFLEKNDKKLF